VRIGGLDESIVSPLSIASRGNEPGASQIRKVPRYFRLIRFENFNARADTQLVVAEELNEAQSGAISQGFEKLFQI
jgi:hypothetical protein